MTSPSSRRAGVVQGSEPTATDPEPSSGVGPAFHLDEPESPLRSYLELGWPPLLDTLLLPDTAERPRRKYLDWHREKIFVEVVG